ncbi:hypothetical protein [Sphaerospermopsis torques-reginae]|uniref:Uncharacterized protein n=1 Tax=Sphaerospermopsis torques-reginae ITEP-024 TaxID=984208 RepID=A0ABX8WYL0_9CYAN|nr:hypothetical protein [Sphaerospermopsis torques-reginae]QYX31539.1 hypothetical protein K2F26_22520 [Sphaerospermopsis torques-reginae ITEP-024]
MNILTNRVKITFHIDAIKQDFAFIRFKRDYDGKWWGAEEIDRIIGDDYQAMSVGYATFAYAMFERKSNNIYQLENRLNNNSKFTKVVAIEVQPEAIYSGNNECICEVSLARLLINSLGSSRSKHKHLHFSNLTGSLLRVPLFTERLLKSIAVAEISIDRIPAEQDEFLLNVSFANYRKKGVILNEYKGEELAKILKRPEYIIYDGTNPPSLKRWLPSSPKEKSDPNKSYIQCREKGTKRHVDFLSFRSRRDFDGSPAGILHNVMNNIEKNLSKYMTVEFCSREIDIDIPLDTRLMNDSEKIKELLDGERIHIIDKVDSEESHELVAQLKQFLYPCYITDEKLITDSRKIEKKPALNLRIIHDESYYQENKLTDQYKKSDHQIQRQNITLESYRQSDEKGWKNIVKTSIKELLIKRDLRAEKITLFDWCKLNTTGDWTFAAWDQEENEAQSHVVFMKIKPNGEFTFHTKEKISLWNWQEFEKYKQFMIDSNSAENKKIRNLEGLVISDTGEINQIFRTDEISLPNLPEIAQILDELESELLENQRTANDLADIVEEFLQVSSELDQEKFNLFSEELRERGSETISKAYLYSLIGQYLGTKRKQKDKEINVSITKEAISFRDYLLEKHQIRLKFPQDNQTKDDLFDPYFNIKYFEQTENLAYYCVGSRKEQLQFSFKDACHLRQIVAVNGSKLIFKELLPTMDVDFVRTGQSTVIPFPFKYIREDLNLR